MAWAIKFSKSNDSYYNPGAMYRVWVSLEKAKHWKTRDAAVRNMEAYKAHRMHEVVYRQKMIEHLEALLVVEVPDRPKKKVTTKKQIALLRAKVKQAFVKAGWKPNREYYRRYWGELDETGESPWGTAFLLSPDEQYALTMKPTVLTLHDARREYCKIVSMQYVNIKLSAKRVTDGILSITI